LGLRERERQQDGDDCAVTCTSRHLLLHRYMKENVVMGTCDKARDEQRCMHGFMGKHDGNTALITWAR